MPLFGNKDHAAKDEANRAALLEAERLMTLSPAELAAVLMPAFGPHGAVPSARPLPGNPVSLRCVELAGWLFSGAPPPSGSPLAPRLEGALREAVQVLEHAELVYLSGQGESISNQKWSATRSGLSALAKGEAVVRQRINDR
ncbi:hypothetical protein A5712_27605 [Mycobacterium sp. E2327]|uniref:hypothetical protein n=1 Tax=Mycobacterium sp. E2327 TaxID=1834132 RepID=UPI0007FD47D7|nr:hypothetical protein [Mycobacterium sp. E2327]OBI15696.1 hypothetical protein A5712_27605 [Mycobacterium sp. E2327]